MRRALLAVALASVASTATAQTTRCGWELGQWVCRQGNTGGVDYGALRTPDIGGSFAAAYAAGAAARREREAREAQARALAQPPAVTSFSKEGANYDDYLKARFDCMKQSTLPDGSLSAGLIVACFAANGWRADPNGFSPPPGQGVAAH